jgi:hypothetical protein
MVTTRDDGDQHPEATGPAAIPGTVGPDDTLEARLAQIRTDLAEGVSVNGESAVDGTVLPTPADVRAARESYIGSLDELPKTGIDPAAVGRTMFDTPSSQDDAVTVLLPQKKIDDLTSQALVRIKSTDRRNYIGVITAGPFAEPDGLKADSPIVVNITVEEGISFIPKYHGRSSIAVLGEELDDGTLVPPRRRPRPNSPVYALTTGESMELLQVAGDIRVGRVFGDDQIAVSIDSSRKDQLPRHTAILGTTGAGKTTTVGGIVNGVQQRKWAQVLVDVEGDYARINEPTDNPRMMAAVKKCDMSPAGVPKTRLWHLVGRGTANPDHPNKIVFTLRFSNLSPYVVAEIAGMNEAQTDRYIDAWEVTKGFMADSGMWPRPQNQEDQRRALELDEFEEGYPTMTLSLLLDVVSIAIQLAGKKPAQEAWLRHPAFKDPKLNQTAAANVAKVEQAFQSSKPSSTSSWKTVYAKLNKLNRLNVFDNTSNGAKYLNHADLLTVGEVNIIDLSDTRSPVLNNLLIADLLRGIVLAQEHKVRTYEDRRRNGQAVGERPKILLTIEEAHRFLSKQRIKQMQHVFEQVADLAARGRKRWFGLLFVTQLPQQLPPEVLGLVNNYILHKVSARVVNDLAENFSEVDDTLWRRLPGLAAGLAIVRFEGMTRPLLVAIDPAVCRLGLVD